MDYLKEKGMNDLKEKETEIKKVRYQLEAKTVKFDAMEKEKKNLQGKVSEMRKLKEVLEVKVAEAETREKGVEDEMEAMKAALNTAAVEYGLLTNIGDTLTITDLCQSLDGMRQLNAHMKLEMIDLEQAKANLEEMLKTSDAYFKSGDSVDEKSIGARERTELKETIKDLRFQAYKQEHLIKKLRYEVSEFHEFILKKQDTKFSDMPYVDRAVVMRIYSDIELKSIDAADLSLPKAQDDDDEDEIGKGAFGKVFLRQYKGQAVAVKVPYISERVNDEDATRRMMRIKANHARTTMEALVHLALADHPSFPKTIGVVDIDGAPSLVLEFLGDKETGDVFSLSQAIKHPSPSLRQKDWFGIITDIVNGMKAMHAKGLLHNDLKPNNVLLQWDYNDKRWHAFIIDMGKVSTQTVPLKHRHMPDDDREQYKEGSMFQHLAPEYMLDQQPMSVQTDIFSMGKIIGRIEGKVMNNRILRDLVAEMTNVKPRLRPLWKDIEKAVAKARKKCLS
nr:uncharacterized protein LOC129260597 [Lytechinus pictus]